MAPLTGAEWVPSPLREVLAWEGVTVPAWVAAPASSQALIVTAEAGQLVRRWELYGLPGLGKTTLAQGLVARLRADGVDALLLPEAVPYAVRVHGIALADLEPFLDRVNAQAETLAVTAARTATSTGTPLVVVRDPAHLQNESYRFVLHARRDEQDPVAHALRELEWAISRGEWAYDVAEEVGRLLWDRHAALRTPPRGQWCLGHIMLTTGDPVADVRLSLARQRDGVRDAGLVTGDAGLLAGYLATLQFVEVASREGLSDVVCVRLDPTSPLRTSAETIAQISYR